MANIARYTYDKDTKHCAAHAAITEEERQKLFSDTSVYHPICYVEALHEHPELFKEFLPEFDKYVKRVKADKVKTPCKTHVAFKITDYAIIHVLADKYETSLAKIGRALVLYSIEEGYKFVARYRKEYGNERQ